MLAEYLAKKGSIDEKINRVSSGNYNFGGVKVLLRNVNGNIVARIGGGWIKLDEYLKRHDEANTRIYHMDHNGEHPTTVQRASTLREINTKSQQSTPNRQRSNSFSGGKPKTVIVRSFSAEQIHQIKL